MSADMANKKKGLSIRQFAVDPTKEREGTWMDVGEGMRVKVARITSPLFEAEMRRLGRPFGRRTFTPTFDDSALVEVMKRAASKTLLLGWENVLEEEGGAPVPYSPAKAFEYFTKYPDFFRLILDMAQDQDAFREEAKAEASGN